MLQGSIGNRSRFLILLMFQIVSLKTTIEGAKILLSSLEVLDFGIFGFNIPLYVLLGCAIQFFLLWLFTFGKREINSFVRLWTLILIYTFASIYFNFFFIYPVFGGEILTAENDQIKQSDEIISMIQSSDPYREYQQLNSQIDNKKKERDIEETNGRGPRYNQLSDEIKRLQDKKALLSVTDQDIQNFENYKKYREQEFNNQKDEEILNKNNYILSLFQEDISFENIENSTPSYFLLPFIKLHQIYYPAILAFIVASVPDLTSLVIGASLDKTRTNNIDSKFKKFRERIAFITGRLWQGTKNFLPRIIEEIGHTVSIIINSFAGIFHGIIFGAIGATKRSLQVFISNFNSIQIEGNRKDFLDFLWRSIEVHNNSNTISVINYKTLMLLCQDNQSFKNGYKKLLFDMCKMGWLKQISQDNQIKFEIVKDDEFDYWYREEESKKFDQEKHNMLAANSYYTMINLPKKYNIRQRICRRIKRAI